MILPPSHCFVPFGPLNCALTSFAKSKVTLMLQQPHKTRSGGWTADRYTEAAGKRTPDRRGTGMGREWRGSRDSSEGALKHRRAGGGGRRDCGGPRPVEPPTRLPCALLPRRTHQTARAALTQGRDPDLGHPERWWDYRRPARPRRRAPAAATRTDWRRHIAQTQPQLRQLPVRSTEARAGALGLLIGRMAANPGRWGGGRGRGSGTWGGRGGAGERRRRRR